MRSENSSLTQKEGLKKMVRLDRLMEGNFGDDSGKRLKEECLVQNKIVFATWKEGGWFSRKLC